MHGRAIFDVDWCHRTGLVATACGDDAIRVFREGHGEAEAAAATPTLDLVASAEAAHSQDVNCVAWNPKSPLLASCSDDGSVRLWTLEMDEDDLAEAAS